MVDLRDRLPPQFVGKIVSLAGPEGQVWLDELPEKIASLERDWSLQVGQPPANLTYNFVAPALLADETEAILKLGLPDSEIVREAAAMEVYGGRGAARLLAFDLERRAMLLELVRPGTTLLALADDEEVTRIAARTMRRLWRPVPVTHPFIHVRVWAGGLGRLRELYGGGTGPLPAAMVDEAERLFEALFSTSGDDVVLHGDLHHDNVLRGEREPWLAIDPKGVIGPPDYDVGPLLHNWLPDLLQVADPPGTLRRRIAILQEELGFDHERIRAWGFAQAVLSAWWSLEDHGEGWEDAIAVAGILRSIRL